MAFPSVSTGDVIEASHIMDIVNAFDGTLNKGVRIQLTQYNSPVNFAVTIRNLDTTNHRALQVLKANDHVLGQFAGAQVQVGNIDVPVDLAGPTAGGGAAGAGSGNYIRVSGGAAGIQPALTARGEDANIDIQLVPKGSGKIDIRGKIDIQGTATVGGALNVNSQLTVTTVSSTTHKFTVSGANQIATLQLNSTLNTQSGTLELAYSGFAVGKIYADTNVMYMDAASHRTLVSGVTKVSVTSNLFKVLTQGEIDAGTLTAAEILQLSGTWNSATTTFTAFRVYVTDTASAAGSKVVDTLVGGVSQFSVDKSGNVTFRGNLSAGATRSLTAYNAGGVYVGQSPVDPGANNLQVQGRLIVGSSSGAAITATGGGSTVIDLGSTTWSGSFLRMDTATLTGSNHALHLNPNFVPSTNVPYLGVFRTHPNLTVNAGVTVTDWRVIWTGGGTGTINGTVTNAYGVYAEAPSFGTNRWAIYASGKTELAGDVLVGATRSLTAYNAGGVYVGQSPVNPGANNLRVESNLYTGRRVGAGIPASYNQSHYLAVLAPDDINGLEITDGVGATPKRMKLGVSFTGGYGWIQTTYEGNAHWDLHLNPSGGNLRVGATRALTAYSTGGVYIGTSPSDPGANNLQVQGSLRVNTAAAGIGAPPQGGSTLVLGAIDNVYEGGELVFKGAGTNPDVSIDNYTGRMRINGTLEFTSGNIALGGGATASLGTIGGSGPATAAQNAWFKFLINGTAYFIPIWQ